MYSVGFPKMDELDLLTKSAKYESRECILKRSFCCLRFLSRHLVKNGSTRTLYEICSKLTNSLEQRQWRSPGIVIINVEQVSHTDLMFLLLTVNKSTSAVLAGWKKVYYSANGQNLFGVNNPKHQNHFIDVISITSTVNFEKIQWSGNSPDVQAVNMLKSPSLVSAHTQIAIIIWDCLFS